MTEISFYHLERQGLEQALPKLLEKALEAGFRALVLGADDERLKALNTHLWTYHPGGFLPHGLVGEGQEDAQPVLLSTEAQPVNQADLLVLVDGAEAQDLTPYKRCLDLFDGRDAEAVQAARERWKAAKAAGHTISYWQQDERGRWQNKAQG